MSKLVWIPLVVVAVVLASAMVVGATAREY
jgi:flagellar basal body-associated protein FliL